LFLHLDLIFEEKVNTFLGSLENLIDFLKKYNLKKEKKNVDERDEHIQLE